jgi:thiamine-phosphate pyrophosphorylase
MPSIITQALSELSLPICVIGGMTPDNARPLVELGAHSVAAISSVYSVEDHQAAAIAFASLFR